jgi:hypothetical protein
VKWFRRFRRFRWGHLRERKLNGLGPETRRTLIAYNPGDEAVVDASAEVSIGFFQVSTIFLGLEELAVRNAG